VIKLVWICFEAEQLGSTVDPLHKFDVSGSEAQETYGFGGSVGL
jgi:hypothetical protein